MKKAYIIYLFVFCLTLCSCSEDTIGITELGDISGTVQDAETDEPLEGVKITTSPASTTVFSDENGYFVLEDVVVDDYSAKAEFNGYITGFEGVSVTENGMSNVAFELEKSRDNNRAPIAPELISPEDLTTDVGLDVDFVWESSDPDQDELTYELEIRNNNNNEVLTFSNITDTTYHVENLNYASKYFWQVKVSDSVNQTVLSEVYSFNTMEAPTDNNYYFVRQIDGNNVIFSSDAEGNEIQLTSSSTNSFRPRKNLNVNLIAFYRIIEGRTHLYTMNLDGSNVKQVTNSIPANGIDMENLGFTWADNGRSLIYPNFDKVYKITTEGSGKDIVYQAGSGRYVMDVQQSEDRSKILILETDINGYDGSIFWIDHQGQVQEMIIQNNRGTLGGLDVSVDNNLILYTRDVSEYESPTRRQLNTKMFLYITNTGQTINLSTEKPNGTNDLDARFAPNEASVIFVNTSSEADAIKSIYKVNFDEDLNTIEENREILIENAKMPDWE
mgnify:CR=1 FL=1